MDNVVKLITFSVYGVYITYMSEHITNKFLEYSFVIEILKFILFIFLEGHIWFNFNTFSVLFFALPFLYLECSYCIRSKLPHRNEIRKYCKQNNNKQHVRVMYIFN